MSKFRVHRLLASCILLVAFAKSWSQTPTFPPGFAAVQVATGLDPVALALAPDGRVFIAEKFGRVMIVENGQLRPEPFLELAVDSYTERGMSGIALDPNFPTNHFVYVYYTVAGANHNRVSRFTADGNFAAPGSEVVLLDLDPLSGPYHNAGALAFDTAGKLLIATGDGFEKNNANSLNSTLGKILRINTDGSIPSDNPFYEDATGANRAIFAMGFRNPFAMMADPTTGRILATDVGSDQFEEVNEIEGGRHFGWPEVEGFLAGTPPPNYKDPLFAYDHGFGCAAVGVTVYAPATPSFPSEYVGRVFFVEHCYNRIYSINPSTNQAELFASNLRTPLNLLTAPDGTLYYLDRKGTQANYATNAGSLWRVFYTGSDAPFVTLQPQSALVPVGEEVTFFVAATGAGPMSFQWQQDGIDIPGATDDTLTFQFPELADSASQLRCIVTNSIGSDTSQAALLRVTSSHRPIPFIGFPQEGQQFRGGEMLYLLGSATDQEEGTLGPGRFRWRVDFHHNDHSHPAFGPVSNTYEDIYTIPSVNEVSDNVWYRVHLTVTDGSGLSASVFRDVLPVKTNIIVQTTPQGFPIYVDTHKRITPDTIRCVSGVYHQIDAPKSHVSTDSIYLFRKWAHGPISTALYEAPTDAGTNLKAVYEAEKEAGDGDGLLGTYYNQGPAGKVFEEPYVFSRIDTTIAFNWVYGTPDTAVLGTDGWLVRWQGAVEPFFDETLNFHLNIHTDAARLWVADQLVIDRWYTSPVVEANGSITLQGGRKYPIKLEYAEEGGQATCQLLWSSEKIARDFVPKSQLYSNYIPDTTATDTLAISIRPNPVKEQLEVLASSPEDVDLQLQLFDLLGKLVLEQDTKVYSGTNIMQVDVAQLPVGQYLVQIELGEVKQTFKMIKI